MAPRQLETIELHPAPEPAYAAASEMAGGGEMTMTYDEPATPLPVQPSRLEAVDPHDPATWRNTPRNAQCPCGSGRKYKQCHGRLT